MNVGLPGTGIGGLFFIISALLALPIELVRLALGRSSPRRLALAARHASIALTMVGALAGSYWLLREAASWLQTHPRGAAQGTSAPRALPHAFPVSPVLLTLGVLATVLAAAYVLRLVAGGRRAARSRRG